MRGLRQPTVAENTASERSMGAFGTLELRRRAVGVLFLASALGGCGFRLRGQQTFVFSSIAVTPQAGSAMAQELRRSFNNTVRVLKANEPLTQAQVVLELQGEQREKTVVGVNASGQVREFQLRMRVSFRLLTPEGVQLMAPDEIVQQRDISYTETAALAKETEEVSLYRDMQTDIVQQILRRLSALKQLTPV